MELSENTNLSVIEARIAGNRDLFTAENLSTKFCFNNGRHWRKRKTHSWNPPPLPKGGDSNFQKSQEGGDGGFFF